jgi:hypothetical protein
MVFYIDESGALNYKPKERFFVITALGIQDKDVRKKLKNIARRAHRKHCIPNNLLEIHGSELTFEAKQDILFKLNKESDIFLDYIVADKKHILQSLFSRKDLTYNYLMAHLVKKITKGLEQDVQLLIDEHTVKAGSLNSLEDYLNIEARTKWDFKYNIKVQIINSKHSKGVQLVDVVANSIFAKYNYKKHHLYNISEDNFRYRIRFPYQKFDT